jgi:hypothetical protein
MTAAAASPSIGPRAEPLTRADLERFLALGIPESLIVQAGIFRVDSSEGARIVGRRPGSGDYSGVVYPYVWPGEDRPCEYRLRRDRPEFEIGSDGKPRERAKYLSPPGARPRLYFVPGTQPGALGDASLPILLTEGEKKTLALHALGDNGADRPRWLPVGIGGVWCWKGAVGIEAGPDGSRRSVKGTIKDFDRLQWRSRRITVIFDTNVRSNPQVQSARWGLTRELRQRGAVVHWWHWPKDTPAGINGIDDLIGAWGPEVVLERWPECERLAPTNFRDCERVFEALDEDRFRLSLPPAMLELELDRLRWSGGELHGELIVRCGLPGVRSTEGIVAAARLNLSSLAARKSFAKELAERARSEEIDWPMLLEELAQRTLAHQRSEIEAVWIDDAPTPSEQDLTIELRGFRLLRRHANLIFAPGGASKSYLSLWMAAQIADQGLPVLYLDSEADIETHRLRKSLLFGNQRHRILYHRMTRPLSEEIDAIRRLVADKGIGFVVLDSVSCAADGPLEESGTAQRLYQALRRIRCGSLLLAHTQKNADPKDRSAFGSGFWGFLARAVWSLERLDDGPDGFIAKLRLTKSNFLPLNEVRCFRFTFSQDRTTIEPVSPAEVPEAAQDLPLADRLAHALRRGPRSAEELAEELDAKADTISRTARRYRKTRFMILDGGKIALRADSEEES